MCVCVCVCVGGCVCIFVISFKTISFENKFCHSSIKLEISSHLIR